VLRITSAAGFGSPFRDSSQNYFGLIREIGDALAEFALPILTASTTQRVIYADAMTAGRTVIEQQPDGPAVDEVRAILAELEGVTT
jgi:UDP-N-acetylglucosamine enolpyruvyl transferase